MDHKRKVKEMSYDINLVNEEGHICTVETHKEGGTHTLKGSNKASLNITYNYAPFYRNTIDEKQELRWLYGKTGNECIERLEHAVKMLGTKQSSDYWEATPGNAGYAISILLKWAKEHPNARFE